jgi:SOS-response transcriptional repressor LexA
MGASAASAPPMSALPLVGEVSAGVPLLAVSRLEEGAGLLLHVGVHLPDIKVAI